MTQRPLTKRQAEILAFLRSYIAEHGYAPTLDAIGRHFAIGLANTHALLKAIQDKGHIAREFNRARAITIVATDGCCPTCGQELPAPATPKAESFDARTR